jgi:GTPase SAR1 family protein
VCFARIFFLLLVLDLKRPLATAPRQLTRWQWVPEVRHFCQNVPFILVGCKRDLRNDARTIAELKKMGQKPVSYEEGQAIAMKIMAHSYIECSAKGKVSWTLSRLIA